MQHHIVYSVLHDGSVFDQIPVGRQVLVELPCRLYPGLQEKVATESSIVLLNIMRPLSGLLNAPQSLRPACGMMYM